MAAWPLLLLALAAAAALVGQAQGLQQTVVWRNGFESGLSNSKQTKLYVFKGDTPALTPVASADWASAAAARSGKFGLAINVTKTGPSLRHVAVQASKRPRPRVCGHTWARGRPPLGWGIGAPQRAKSS